MKLNREELAWAAGFVDGEGSFIVNKSKHKEKIYSTLRLVVSQVDRRALDRLKNCLGVGNIYGPYKDKRINHREFWQFKTSAFETTQYTIALLWTWLGEVKKEQAIKSLLHIITLCPNKKI